MSKPNKLKFNKRFPEPQTVKEARTRLDQVIAAMNKIQHQLGDKARKRRSKPEDYQQWRSTALVALEYRDNERALLKNWLSQQKLAVHDRTMALLCRTIPILEDTDLDTKELSLLETIKSHTAPFKGGHMKDNHGETHQQEVVAS